MAASPFDPVADVARVMAGYRHPWFVSGGWAIDLYIGEVTREHEDLEVGACLPHQDDLRRHLAAWQLSRIRNDTWEAWAPGDPIALPEFQVQARSEGLAPHVFDIFFNPLDGDDWVSRRHPDLRVPMGHVVQLTARQPGIPSPIPYLAPEVQLLYKAKYHRPKDEADFAAAVVFLSAAQRAWLSEALRIHQPDDPWIARL